MLYCQPVFKRGTGFGNRLFPWARCRIFSNKNEVPMLRPFWLKPRMGPLFRGGVSLKAYPNQILLFGLFQSTRDEIAGAKRLWLSSSAKRVSEFTGESWISEQYSRSLVVTFAGDANHFADLDGSHDFLLKELRAMTKSKWIGIADRLPEIPIGINVRLGNDFKTAKSRSDYFRMGGVKTPITWFIECLNLIREKVGFAARAVVVSDGTERSLSSLLRVPNVTFLRPGCAISDLLTLSRAKILIGSGGSSFSAWASFLGQMPTITHPGQSLSWFKINNRRGHYIGEFDPQTPSDQFLSDVEDCLIA